MEFLSYFVLSRVRKLNLFPILESEDRCPKIKCQQNSSQHRKNVNLFAVERFFFDQTRFTEIFKFLLSELNLGLVSREKRENVNTD